MKTRACLKYSVNGCRLQIPKISTVDLGIDEGREKLGRLIYPPLALLSSFKMAALTRESVHTMKFSNLPLACFNDVSDCKLYLVLIEWD